VFDNLPSRKVESYISSSFPPFFLFSFPKHHHHHPFFLNTKMRLFATSFALCATLLAGLSNAQVTAKSGLTADSHCGDGYCITGLYEASKKMINYTLVVPQGGSQ
jgi:hypothetical protein